MRPVNHKDTQGWSSHADNVQVFLFKPLLYQIFLLYHFQKVTKSPSKVCLYTIHSVKYNFNITSFNIRVLYRILLFVFKPQLNSSDFVSKLHSSKHMAIINNNPCSLNQFTNKSIST